MEKSLLSFSNYLRDLKRIYFAVFFLFSSSFGFAQTITTNKTITANAGNCGIVNVKLDITGSNPVTRNSDVILVIDVSGSMGNTISNDTKTSMDYAKLAAKSFISQASANTTNRIAIVSYTTNAKLELGLTYLNAAGVTALNAKIDALTATSNTNIQDGIVKAETELEANGRFDCATARSIILLTDGVTNRTGPSGNTTTCNTTSTSSTCVTSAITAATNAKTTVKSSVTYNNQIFSVGLFGGIPGNISTVGSDQYVAKYTLDGIQGSAAYITQSGANLTSIYNLIATQISWVAQSLIQKETIIPGFTIGSITTTKGTASLSGQVITWNTDFLNSETITLNYQLTPTGTACGTQTVSTSTLNYQNTACASDSKIITSPTYFVPCPPVITGVLSACGSTTLTATTNATSPTYVWYKDNVEISGQTTATLIVTTSGAYKVKVKNGTTNCELTSAVSNVVISPAAALTAPTNTTIAGCGTNAITGLPYSAASANITLAQLTAAGGLLPNSALIGTYTISYSDAATSTCPIVVTRTFKVSTSCGNITASQTITIQDITAPSWTTTSNALNITLQCSDSSGLTNAQNQAPTATDNCGGTVTYTKTSGTFTAGSCINSGTYTNTWIAKDVCLNTSTIYTQVITIEDTTAPTWTTPSGTLDVTLQCSDTAGLTTAQNQAPVATDNCGGTVIYTKTSGTFTAGSCINSGTYINTWVAKDVCLNTSAIFTQVITIEDTTAPSWTMTSNALNVTLQCSDSSGLTSAQNQAPTATDNCGGTVTYTKTSGAFTAGSCINSGTYTNTWIAKDVCLNTSTIFTQVITIEDNTSPTWTTTSNALNITLQCSDTVGLTTAQNQAPIATDNCGGAVTYTKTSGVLTAGSCINSGTYTNTWVANDVCLNTSTIFTQVITIEDNTAPTWTTTSSALNVTLQCNDSSGLTNAQNQAPIAADNCGGTVTYTKTNGAFMAGSCINSGTYTNTWIAKDVCFNTSTIFTQVITIEDTIAPTWTTTSNALNVTLQCSDSSGLTNAQNQSPVANDNCDGTITYTKTSGTFTAGSCINSGTYTNTWIAKDVCLNTSTIYTQVITIEDTTAPSWTTQSGTLDVTLQCSDTAGLTTAQNQTPTATDNCGGTVTYTKTSGAFTAGSCINSGTYTNTWIAKDVCLNTSAIFIQVITIEDNTEPTWTTTPNALNVTLQCSDSSGLTNAQNQAPVATDNCGGTITYTKTSGTFTAGSCINSGTYTNTWIAKDVCLNTSTIYTQVITIEDTTAPTWTTPSGTLDVTLQCSDSSGLTNAQNQAPVATDNCGGTVIYTKVSGELQRGICGSTGTYTNLWTAHDICNNTSVVFTQVITVQDSAIPTWITQAGMLNTTLQCSDIAGLATAQNQAPVATANCSFVTYTKTTGSFIASEGCANSGTYTNSWIAKDDCGNVTESFSQVISIEDTTAPTWITEVETLNVTIQCSDVEALASAQAKFPIANDSCDGDVSNIIKTSGSFIASENCANSGTYTNSWIVKDDCGNTSETFTQVITIEDTTSPSWTTPSGTLDVTLQCSDSSGLTNAQNQAPVATDNCGGTVIYIKVSGELQRGICGSTGTYTNLWTANDVCNNTSVVFTQVITVQDSAIPTWITQAGMLNTTLQCSDIAGLTTAQNQAPVATANCSFVTYTKTTGPFIASEGCANSGTYTNSWIAKDDCGNVTESFSQVITIEDTTAPTWITEVETLNTTVQCSDVEALASAQAKFPIANDSCDGDVSNIVKTSGSFIASEGCANSGTYTNSWIIKDNCKNTSETFTQVITIEDTTAPIWATEVGTLNITVQCSDVEALALAQAKFPIANDSCDGDVSNIVKTSGQFMASEGCANSGTYTNSWIVKDDCGNTSETFTQVITIEDTTAPTWATEVGTLNTTVQCSDVEALILAQAKFPIATDSCDGDVSNVVKISGQFIASESCANYGTYTNSWIVKDDCGNTSETFTQVIIIEDTTAPTWATEVGTLNITVQCSDVEALILAQAKFPIATDSCDGDVSNIVKTSGSFIASEGCANSGTYTNSWIIKDNCKNTSETFTQVITIEDTTAPIWATEVGTLNITVQCSDVEALALAQAKFPIATDSCDDNVSNIIKTSGSFIASESCANYGTYTNSWIVKDDCGNTSETFTQVIIIEDTTAPTWATEVGTLNITVQCSDVEALILAQAKFPIATDSCDGDVSNIVKTSGSFIASEGCANSGTYTNSWIIKDNCKNTSETFTQVITIEDTTAPIWATEVGTLNITVQCSDVEALALAQAKFPIATDSCDDNVSNIIKTSGQFIASESCANYGTYTNSWIVKDDCGNTSETFTQVIIIEDTTAPTWVTEVGTLNTTVQCSDVEALALAQAKFPIANDSCDGDVSNIVKTSGQFVASENCANSGTYTNSWIVKDDCGNTSESFTQIITIEDTTAPTWVTEVGTLNTTVQCSDVEALALAQAKFPIANDSCDGDVSNIVKTSGQFMASEGCANSGTYTNSWIVKDDCGNTSETFTQVITIEDTNKPIFSGNLPTDITVSCDAIPEPAQLMVSDNCNLDLPIVFTETKSDIQNECASNYTLTRNWTTSDCSANTASYTQIIIVRDTTAPTGTAPADAAGLQSITDIPVGNSQDIHDVADNCDSNVTITINDTNNGANGCDGAAYVLTRTYTLTDCSGNKTKLIQTFTVENKVSVSAVVSNVTCLGGTDGMITVTSSQGSTVIIRNQNNEVVGNTNLPAGTYTLTATSAVNNENQTCTATTTVTITEPLYKVKISGQIINIDNNTPIANVPVTLVPQGTTTGPILFRLTDANGMYSFTDMVPGNYLVQVQDANLNSAYQLYPVDSSLFFTTLEECKFQVHNFEYGASTLPVLGDYVWYDTNGNGIQDEWYDANNDGVVTKNIPDSNGAIDYSLWEWIDFNGDGSFTGPQNLGELNAGGFGNALSPNVIIDGPDGYHKDVIIGIQGYWRNRPDAANPYGDYNVKLVRDANFDTASTALGATGLVKVLPSVTAKNITSKTAKTQLHTICQITSPDGFIATVTPTDLVHLDIDFGVVCKTYSDIVANDDNAGPIVGVNITTPNVLNVLLNDTIEGVVVTASDVIITTITTNDFLQLNPDGSVDVLPNAPVGTLTMVYQICEADDTSNCDTATVTVTIVAPVMTVSATPICVNDVPYIDYVVTPDNFTPQNGVTIAWTDSNNNLITTMTDLPLSGRVLWPGAVVDQAGNGVDWPGWIFQNNQWIEGADGFETLRPTATLAISVNPSQTITVNYPPADPYCIARPTFAIVANDDSAGPVNGIPGATNVLNVYTNDTLNNTAVNPNDVTLTLVTPDPSGALTLNPDGSVSVAPNTPAGTYTLTYQICEIADFGNCDTAIVTVIVSSSVIVANDDSYNNIGCNTFGLVGNVLSNDLLNLGPATLELVNLTLLNDNNTEKTNADITIDASGNVTVSSATPAGTYTYNYQICEKLNPNNCDTATVTIIVVPTGSIAITSDACNDDSTLINLQNLLPENTPLTGTWIDTNTSNALQGAIFNPYGLALGNYAFEYTIADENCPRSVVLSMEVNDDCRVLACGTVVIHNAFSPNGDGKNDFFQIDNIDEVTCYPENSVEIYNRWGILVFDTFNYNNTTNAFDGTSGGRTTIKQSDGLPTGTYFYIITYKSLDGNNAIQTHKEDGYLYLSR